MEDNGITTSESKELNNDQFSKLSAKSYPDEFFSNTVAASQLASRNGDSSLVLDSSGSDCGRETLNLGLASRSFTNSDSALPISYATEPCPNRAPSLPPARGSKSSASPLSKASPPEVPLRTTSSPQKTERIPVFVGREWVFEKIYRWLQIMPDGTAGSAEATSCSVIILGGPGTGKTAIFNQLVKGNTLGLSKRLLAYHACSNQFAASLNLPRFILSLRDQLAERKDEIGDFYRQRLASSGNRLARLFTSARLCAFPDEVLSEGVFKVLSDMDPSRITGGQKLFLAIDAADECLRMSPQSEVRAPPSVATIGCFHKRLSQASSVSDPTNELQNLNIHPSTGRIRQGWVSRNLLELLAINALFLPPWIGLLITCRRESQTILRRLFRCAATLILDDLRSTVVAKDISDYVHARLRSEDSLQNSFSLCHGVGQDILQMLQFKSNASYLYLQIVLNAVSDRWLTQEHIKTIPGTLSGLFLWLCQHLLTPLPNDVSISLLTTIKPALNLILASPRPLTITEIDVILQVNVVSPFTREYWKNVLSLPYFIVNDYPKYFNQQPDQWIRLLDYAGLQKEKVLMLAHSSFRDWLLDVKYSTPVYFCSARDGHTMLAIAALNQIRQSPSLSHSFTWDILYNFTCSSLYNSADALQRLTSALKDVELDFSTDAFGNIDCWAFLQDPILVHCSFAGSSITQLIEDALNYEHRAGPPPPPQLSTATTTACNGTRPRERKPKPVILQTGADKETSIGQLCTAAFQGKLEVVKEILNQQGPVDVEARDVAGSTPLVLAARQGHIEIVRYLLAANARMDQIDQDGWSALRSAAWGGHADVVNLLLEAGVEVDITGPDRRTALRAAAWAGHRDIVRRLLDAGAAVNRTDVEGRTPLIAAAYMASPDIVSILADAGADLNHADQDGRTALCVAAFCVKPSKAHTEVVATLLQLGADPNLGDRENVTPLIGAAQTGRLAVCELCLEADADVDLLDKSDRSALVASVVNGHVDVVQLLLFWCAAVDTIDANGRSVLSIAAACGHTAVVQKLLDRGLDEAHRDHMGATPLHLAAAAGHAEVVRLLLEAGSRPEETDNAGQTPLLVACQADHLPVIKLLLKPVIAAEIGGGCSGSEGGSDGVADLLESLVTSGEEDVDPHRVYDPLSTGGPDGSLGQATRGTVDRAAMDGRCPLRAAALNNNIPLVKLLMRLGADPDQQDSCGRTTLCVVVLEGLVKMAKVLLFTSSAHLKYKERKPDNRNASRRSCHLAAASLAVGANPLLADDEGRCPLHIAAWQGHAELVYLLLQVGTPVDVRDKENRTPLHSAAWQDHAKICRILLEQGASVNAVCSQGASALCIASQEGHIATCEVLLKNGANALQLDAYGRTPHKMATKAGHRNVCALLERYGGFAPSGGVGNGPPSSPRQGHRQKHHHHLHHHQVATSSVQQQQPAPPVPPKSSPQQQGLQNPLQIKHIPHSSMFAFQNAAPKMSSGVTAGPNFVRSAVDSSEAYAQPAICLMTPDVPMPPPHLNQKQPQPAAFQHHNYNSNHQHPTPNFQTQAQMMPFDPNHWQSIFQPTARFTQPWGPSRAGGEAATIYLQPSAPQPGAYLPPPLVLGPPYDVGGGGGQPLTYVLSPQGFMIPAQSPYFLPTASQSVPMLQPLTVAPMPGGFSASRMVVSPPCLISVSPTNAANAASAAPATMAGPSTSTIIRPSKSSDQHAQLLLQQNQLPHFVDIAPDEAISRHHPNAQEQPVNVTFSSTSIASPIVCEASMVSYHYSAAAAPLEDTQMAERPTIQLIVNTKLGEDVINLNEVTDSEYESSVWVSRRQAEPQSVFKKVNKLSSKQTGTSSEEKTHHQHHHNNNHGSKVKAALQGAWKGARRKKNALAAMTELSSTVPGRDQKQEFKEQQQTQQQKQQSPETHF